MTDMQRCKPNTMAVARLRREFRKAGKDFKRPTALNYRLHRRMHPLAIADVRPGFRNWRWGKRIR